MSVNITIAGASLPEPSNAADTNWAAMQLAVIQALAAQVAAGPAVQRLSSNVTPVGTGADTTEDTLMSYSLPGGTLAAAGQGLRVTAWGTGVNTSDLTTVRGYFGAALVVSKQLAASTTNVWMVTFNIHRITNTTQTSSGAFLGAGNTILNPAPTETLSSSVLLKVTGQRASTSIANSIVQSAMLVELVP